MPEKSLERIEKMNEQLEEFVHLVGRNLTFRYNEDYEDCRRALGHACTLTDMITRTTRTMIDEYDEALKRPKTAKEFMKAAIELGEKNDT